VGGISPADVGDGAIALGHVELAILVRTWLLTAGQKCGHSKHFEVGFVHRTRFSPE
jgi:hypothetical protein